MALDVAEAAVLFFPPFRRHFVEERGIHAAVELIDVHGINPFSKTLVFCLQPLDCCFMFLAFIRMAGVKSFADPVQDLVVKPQAAEHFGELLFENLFAHMLAAAGRGIALALIRIAGAVVVNVLLLFDLADD